MPASDAASPAGWRTRLAGKSVFHEFVGAHPGADATRVLAIDGGGVRGIIPARVLAEIESRTGRSVVELFDLVAGTSTGALLALSLVVPRPQGGPRWTAAACAQIYTQAGHQIFDRSLLGVGAFHEKYRHESIERFLDEHFGDLCLKDTLVSVIVTSYDLISRQVQIFDSRSARLDPSLDFPIKTVARAATAAPTFFDPALVRSAQSDEHHMLLDGGVFANNPAMCAFSEVQKEGATDVVMVSLGTGEEVQRFDWDQVQNWGLAQWARPILHVVFDGVGQSIDFQLQHLLGPERYHRIQCPLQHASHDLDDASPENIAQLEEESARTIQAHDDELDTLCKLLVR